MSVIGTVFLAIGIIGLTPADMCVSTTCAMAIAFLTSTPKVVFNAYHISTSVQLGMPACRFVQERFRAHEARSFQKTGISIRSR